MGSIGNEQLPSAINNPFSKNKVTRISVSFAEYFGNWKAYGQLVFENGNTKGEQKFIGETFDDVVLQIKACLDNLNSVNQ